MQIQKLSDKELSKKLELLVKTERITSVEVLLHLAELDERRLYVEEGYASLYSYCTRKLRYSEPSANRRIASARAGRRYPELLSLIAKGQLSLTTTSLMAGILNDGNKDELIQKCCDKSRAEVEAMFELFDPQQVFRTAGFWEGIYGSVYGAKGFKQGCSLFRGLSESTRGNLSQIIDCEGT